MTFTEMKQRFIRMERIRHHEEMAHLYETNAGDMDLEREIALHRKLKFPIAPFARNPRTGLRRPPP